MWFHSALRRIKGFIYASFVIPKEIKNILPTDYFKASSVSWKTWKQLKLFTLLGPREWLGGVYVPEQNLGGSKNPSRCSNSRSS